MTVSMNEKKSDYLKLVVNSAAMPVVENEDQLSTISDQVDLHKYFVNEAMGSYELSWEEAAFSWSENVALPIKNAIDHWAVRQAFPDYTETQLFFAISSHWYFLKEKYPEISAEDAAINYGRVYGSGLGSLICKFHDHIQ